MDLTSLNEKQKDAVTAPLGAVLVLAGAGSGKTRVLAFRIAYLIENKLVPADNILAVTFTNKAAKEMQNRVVQLLSGKEFQGNAGQPTVGTFHSLGVRILRKNISILGYNSAFTIFDSDDQLTVLKEICKELGIAERFSASFFRALISKAKNNLQTPGEFNTPLDKGLLELVRGVYAKYQDFLFRQNAVDFDDLLFLPIRIWQSRPEILEFYRQKFQYILVDEYQDTNQAQYIFLKLLVEKKGNLFVVGDDAQSIYGFRGSNIANILNFEKDFPRAQVVKLEQNYRSTKYILKAAQSVINLNSEQKKKELWTENEEGRKIHIEEVGSEREEGRFVANEIVAISTGKNRPENESVYEEDKSVLEEEQVVDEENFRPFSILDQFLKKASIRTGSLYSPKISHLPDNHGPLSQFAVLYRTHAQSRALEECFMEAGIPYHIVGGLKFYERKEVKDVLAYAKLVFWCFDIVSLKRALNVPARGLGDKSLQVIKNFLNSLSENLNKEDLRNFHFERIIEGVGALPLSPKQRASAIDFFNLLLDCSLVEESLPVSKILELIIKKAGFKAWFDDGTEIGAARFENIEELQTVSKKYDNLPWVEGLSLFLEEVALFTDIDTMEEQKDVVTLMTLHSAKGLEFDIVFFVGLEEGILPHSRSLLDQNELSEEIRLAYVGLTRARKELFLVHARSRSIYGSSRPGVPSRILRVLPQEIVKGRVPNLPVSDFSSSVSYEPFEE